MPPPPPPSWVCQGQEFYELHDNAITEAEPITLHREDRRQALTPWSQVAGWAGGSMCLCVFVWVCLGRRAAAVSLAA